MHKAPNLLIANAFDRAAARYDEHAHLQHASTQLLFESIKSCLLPNTMILDLGCGTGYLGKLLAQYISVPYHLYQLDIAYNMCKQSLAQGTAIQGDIESLPFALSCMDIITSSMTLQWLDDLSAIFKNINKLLVPGGRFTGTIVGDKSLSELISSFHEARINITPINKFPTLTEINHALHTANITSATIELWQPEQLYDNVFMLLRYFKAIGANALKQKNKSTLTKARLHLLDFYYRKNFQRPNGQIPISWQIYKVQWVKLV